MVEKNSMNHGAKRKIKYVTSSYKVKSKKAANPKNDGCWISGKLGYRKRYCFIQQKKIKAFEENKGHAYTSNPTHER